jgi:fatty acid desaturase
MNEEEIRAEAIRRIKAKREFSQHVVAYVVVNAALVAIWATTNSDGYFWPVWPMLGWGVGLAFHAYTTFGERPITEEEIQREIKRRS